MSSDTDARVGAKLGRGGIVPYPAWAPPERQLPRMTKARLLSLRDMIEAELQRRG